MAIAGNDIAISNTSSAVNQITFNPIITALTGTGAVTPNVYTPQTLTNPVTSNANEAGTDSLWGGLGGGTTPRTTTPQGAIGAGQTLPYTDPNAIAVKTNPQTMIWVLVFGGMAFVLMSGGGGRR